MNADNLRGEAALAVPDRMRRAVLVRPGEIRIEETPTPKPGPSEVLVRVVAATTCGSDLKAYLRGHPKMPMPGPFGHEYSGIVAASGVGASFEPGQAVMGVHTAPCRACLWCERGQENLCESIMDTMVLGAYAEYLLIPHRIASANLFAKPDDLPFEVACLLEPLSCVAQALELAPPRVGDRCLVIGPGAIGLMFVAGLRRLGVQEIVLAGRNPERLAVGERLGARTASLREADLPNSFDLVIECTGQVEIWERSVSFARRGGTVILFGGCPPGTQARFDTARLHYDQIRLVSPFHFGTAAVRQAREWLLEPGFDLRPLLSGDRPLDELEAAFNDLQAGRGLKFVIRP
ncbi:MAG: alcohol dehydrogenase catalytic domain-containing protein [Fimbriimonas ginsengisoli]|uniref:Alcohol dehydrogenase catalytic domain-containing protein n=1 Tax=Fimbriimonas ginsengisoli TaxID=1005039 RepID=A0A931LXC0_FIMGI|nr:alcohol dehydrogenase catalytic domain-containing protein [Fimbriimonas ginsengisoli]MBI3721932.1 alcohol dehydrogenase catalytic domain-containing protein [Fimbriimonas ginsengisoli]